VVQFRNEVAVDDVEAVFVIDDLLDVVDVEVVERFFDRGDIHSALGEVGDQADF
jgi:hypothetical protein